MTREEYHKHTDIASVEDAQNYLAKTRILFITVFLAILIINVLDRMEGFDSDAFLFIWLAYIGLLIYFVVYCVKLIKLTRKVSSASAFWAIIFAPISWIWFYPELVKPLKIIIGELPPPVSLPSSEAIRERIEAKNRKFWKAFLYVMIALVAILALVVGVAIFNDPGSQISSQNSATITDPLYKDKDSDGYRFQSDANGFKAVFPNAPSRGNQADHLEGIGSVETVTYASTFEDSTYFVIIHNYDSQLMSDQNPDFSAKGALEGALNGMVNSDPDGKIILQSEAMFRGNDALRYKIQIRDEILDGLMVYRGQSLYNVLVDYYSTQPVPSNKTSEFINSFEFIN